MLKRKFEGVWIGDRPNQPKQFCFPDRKFGSSIIVSRKFIKDWFGKFPWLHYDELNDRTFCHFVILMEWAKRKGSNYTSHDMQEEMLKVVALKIFREIAAEIRSAEFHAIMADETSDISNTEQLVICIRWVDDDLNYPEEFTGFHGDHQCQDHCKGD